MIFAGNVTLFGNGGFTDRKNAIGVKLSSLKLHEASKDHNDTVDASKDFFGGLLKHKSDIYSSLSQSYKQQVAKNKSSIDFNHRRHCCVRSKKYRTVFHRV